MLRVNLKAKSIFAHAADSSAHRAPHATWERCSAYNIASLAQKRAAFVVNNCRAKITLADQAEDALRDYRMPIAPVRLGSRVAFIKSLAEGKGVLEFEPNGPSATEIAKLYASIVKQLGVNRPGFAGGSNS